MSARLLPLPNATLQRMEHDSFGRIGVPATALWGAQTERSRRFFAIGTQRMPMALIRAMAEIKQAAAEVHAELGLLSSDKAAAIAAAAARIAAGEHEAQFPLSVWQTGSGTQSHMNVNEVIANLASQTLGGPIGEGRLVHAHDEVNRGQSSNDVFPSALHLAALAATRRLLEALARLRLTLLQLAGTLQAVPKLGRTHLQDALPISFGQVFDAYAAQLQLAEQALRAALPALQQLPLGGTAVGTGQNTHPEFGLHVVARLAARLGEPLRRCDHPLAAQAGQEAAVGLHAALRLLAIALTKIANDLRLMASGPRGGLGELHLPANEPGSSMMPGKVNPTQIEALTMVCTLILGHDVALGVAAAQGQLELNTYQPLIALLLLDSLELLGDAMDSFDRHCLQGLEVDAPHARALLARSLMGVTALVPHIGHERAAHIAQHAQAQGLALREAAVEVGGISAAQFDAWVDLRRLLPPPP